MRAPRWTLPGEVYAYRTRKPGALLGLPVLGRHWAYVGQTRNPRARHGEHLNGGGRYGRPPAPWSDLDPKRYVLFRLAHCPQWLLDFVEWLVIHLVWPVYNDRMNRWNPRRITRRAAALQRSLRDRRVPVVYVRAYHVLLLAALVLLAWAVVQS